MNWETHVQNRHNAVAMILHWGFAALFAYGVFKQVGDLSDLQDPGLLLFEMIFAAIFLALLGGRYVYMQRHYRSPLPPDTPQWQIGLASYVQSGMYLTLGTTAVSGLVMGTLVYSGITTGIWMKAMLGAHMLSVQMAYWLIGIHVLGALYHRARQDGVWESMVPTRKR